jgi:hypothetical protein
MMTRNRPTETREERARRKFHALRFQLATITLRDREGSTRRLPVVYVHSPSRNTYCVTCSPAGQPTHCDCADCRRPWAEDPTEQGATRCYHQIAAEWWITGNPPELPRPAFDLAGEAARLASLEEQEARHAQALRDRDRLW